MDPAELDRAFFPAPSGTFSALTAGPEDGDLVIFLHGFPEFADSWSAILAQVGEAGYRAVAFDQRGYSRALSPITVSISC